jgi:ABC-type lipoprotein release transport system permease subunit
MIHRISGFLLLLGRGLQQFPLRATLTVIGIAIGVAAFVAIQLANHSILDSFQRTINTVAGRSTLVVTAGEPGFDEIFLLKVQAAQEVEYAAPLIMSIAPVEGRRGEVLLVLGVDLLVFRRDSPPDGGRRHYAPHRKSSPHICDPGPLGTPRARPSPGRTSSPHGHRYRPGRL